MVLCVMKSVNLKTDTIKILRICFSYIKSLENNESYRKHIEFEEIIEIMENVTANN